MNKIFTFISRHKGKIILFGLIISVSGYFAWDKLFAKEESTRYVAAPVERGVLTSSISATGQVSALNQVDLKPLSSGQITAVNVKPGDLVKKGKVLVALDQRDASVSVLQAKSSYASTEASYNKLVADLNPNEGSKTAQLDLEKAKIDAANSIATADAAIETAAINLKKAEGGEDSQIVNEAYEDAVIFLHSVIIKLDDALTQVDNILGIDNSLANDEFENYLSILNSSYLNEARSNYLVSKELKKKARDAISSLSVKSDHSLIESAFVKVEDTLVRMNILAANMTDVMESTPPVGTLTQSAVDSKKSAMISVRNTVTGQYTSFLTQKKTLNSAKDSYVTYKMAYDKAVRDLEATKVSTANTIRSKELALEQSKSDIKTARAQLDSSRAQLSSAYNEYNNNLVVAPFDGQVAVVAAKKGDQASSGSTAVTLITKQKIATVTLNEVDAAKVKIGQKAILTFDAIEELSLTGEVVEIDALGTVSQGVVSYGVKIVFDVQDDRVKSGMSTSANIILSSKADVLLVSSSAIKSQAGVSYVEVLVNNLPERKTVEVGESNDTMTEIATGLNEGDVVITQTIKSTQTSATNPTTNSTNARPQGGLGGGGEAGIYRVIR